MVRPVGRNSASVLRCSRRERGSTLDRCKAGGVAGLVLIERKHVATRDCGTGFVDVGLGSCQIIALFGGAFRNALVDELTRR